MRIVPYESFGEVRLGENENSVEQRLGSPDRRAINRAGEVEMQYREMVVRIGPQGATVEITARPETVELGDDSLSRHDLPEFLAKIDQQSTQEHGFVVSRRFGIAVDTDTINDGWITVFVAGRWDAVGFP